VAVCHAKVGNCQALKSKTQAETLGFFFVRDLSVTNSDEYPHNRPLVVIHKVTVVHTPSFHRDSRQAILPDALRVNANMFQTDLCRNPEHKDVIA
jgi:hypothetical protein